MHGKSGNVISDGIEASAIRGLVATRECERRESRDGDDDDDDDDDDVVVVPAEAGRRAVRGVRGTTVERD
jgi:hypothetical protein